MKGIASTAVALYRMIRRQRIDKNIINEAKKVEETYDIKNAILQSAFPEYDPKNLIQSGDPLLWVTIPDGTHWRIGIDHIYGIKDVAIFARVFFEPHDFRGRRFYANKTSGKVVVNPQERLMPLFPGDQHLVGEGGVAGGDGE